MIFQALALFGIQPALNFSWLLIICLFVESFVVIISLFMLFVVGLYCKTINLCEDLHHQNLIEIMPIYVAQPLCYGVFHWYIVKHVSELVLILILQQFYLIKNGRAIFMNSYLFIVFRSLFTCRDRLYVQICSLICLLL